eukprot:TRINITY_DN3356_c0_g1_i1.p1 TRINITY_DN3356_c0_g1~~TRINITY_DN3356_c0_g1_i1.p1  ORF type:complete len:175 (-),score=14.32 TRINITY_DN3356_c0_g1_i1:305-802(-)
MDDPLLAGGEEKKATGLVCGVSIPVVLFMLFSVTICIVFGIQKNAPEHYIMGGLTLALLILFLILMLWFWKGELEGKVKYLILIVLLCALLAGIAANMYAWRYLLPNDCMGDGMFYSQSTHSCLSMQLGSCNKPHNCLEYVSPNTFRCIGNCTKYYLEKINANIN